MNKETEKMLTYDPLYEIEKSLGGKHWSEFNEQESLLSFVNNYLFNKNKTQHLKLIKDTNNDTTWDELKAMLLERGFKDGYSYDFTYDDRVEEAILYYHPSKGIIIFATSWNNKSIINSGSSYAQIKANDKDGEEIIWKWLSTGGCDDINNKIYSTSQDIREGLFSKLDELEKGGRFLNKWIKKKPLLWFVDYVEKREEGYDYKKINCEKINKCPKEMQDIIGIR